MNVIRDITTNDEVIEAALDICDGDPCDDDASSEAMQDFVRRWWIAVVILTVPEAPS